MAGPSKKVFYIDTMTRFTLAAIVLLALAMPTFATTLEERIAEGERWVNVMEWVEICTTGRSWKFSEAERLKVCLEVEQQLRDQGRCMYSPGVLGIWDGRHCR
jgi:hypothetical protein